MQICFTTKIIGIRCCQAEALCKLQRWDDLSELVKTGPMLETSGSTYATLLSYLHDEKKDLLKECLRVARLKLVDALFAVTVNDLATYTQSYKITSQ